MLDSARLQFFPPAHFFQAYRRVFSRVFPQLISNSCSFSDHPQFCLASPPAACSTWPYRPSSLFVSKAGQVPVASSLSLTAKLIVPIVASSSPCAV